MRNLADDQIFVIMPFRAPYEAVYKDAIQPAIASCGFQAERADQIPASTFVAEDIRTSIARCSLVIVETSEHNPNVYYELGVADVYRKEIILISRKDREDEIPFDTHHLRHFMYDVNYTDAFSKELEHLIQATRAYRLKQLRKTAKTLTRGEILPDFFDAAVFLWNTGQDLRIEIMKCLRTGQVLSTALLYQSFRGTQNWLDLCNDPAYAPFHESVENIQLNAGRFLEALGDDFLQSIPDIISLGPGNGVKDRSIIRAYVDYMRRCNLVLDCFYYPVDISLAMLAAAVDCIRQDHELAMQLRLKCIHADFAMVRLFSPVFDFRPSPNMYLMLGNTLGNMPREAEFLKILFSSMLPKDALLLETRTQTGHEMDLGGQDILRARFNFEPLAQLGLPFNKDRIVYNKGYLSQVPGAITVACEHDNTRVGDEEFGNVTLSCVNYYDINRLEKLLIGIGFEIILKEVMGMMNYILARKPDRS